MMYRNCKRCETFWIGDMPCWNCGEPTPIGKAPSFSNPHSPPETPPDPQDSRHHKVNVLR